jgi:hypothetical protein
MLTSVAVADIEVWDDAEQSCRMRKKAVQQGRSEQRGESCYLPYVEPLSEARTPLADFFRILLDTVVSRPNRYTTESLWIQSHVAMDILAVATSTSSTVQLYVLRRL